MVARVLVVDDATDVRDLLAEWLRQAGHEVLAVSTGHAALAAVDCVGEPDIAVLDAGLPGMDGVQLLSRLRERQPWLPAVFVTVLWSAADLERIRSTGAVVLAKPASGSCLRDAVRRLLSDHCSPAPGDSGCR